MNILYYGLGKNQGGIETYLYKIARNINRSSYKLFFIDETEGNACFKKELKELGAVFFNITPRRTSIVRNRKDLNELFDNNKIEILHFNCNTLSYITPITVALKHGVKVVLHSRNSHSVLLSRVLHRLNYFWLWNIYNPNIKKIAVSKMAGEWMFGKYGEFQVFNNGIEVEHFRFSSNIRSSKRKELSVISKHVYGNVGTFLKAKNHAFIIDVFKEISDDDEDAVLLLIGDGPLRKEIEQKVKQAGLENKVLFLGIRSDIPALMMAMDLLIFPSIYEGFPNVVLEAETTGLPIVMSDIITKEVVLLESCKRLSFERTSGEWAKMCRKLLIRNQMERFSRETAADLIDQAGFSVKKEVERLEKMYEEIVKA